MGLLLGLSSVAAAPDASVGFGRLSVAWEFMSRSANSVKRPHGVDEHLRHAHVFSLVGPVEAVEF